MRTTIFIGHHKTGSTALQHSLAAASKCLLDQGILYPAVDFQGLAHLAAVQSGRESSLPLNYAEAHNALAFKLIAENGGGPVPKIHTQLPHSSQMRRAISEQAERFCPVQMVLASEVFANFGAIDPRLIDDVAEMCGPDTRIMATLRRPDDYLVSWHLQRLRFGERPGHLSERIRDYFTTIHVDYRKMLSPWISRFGRARTTVTPYSEVVSEGGAVTHFSRRTGADFGGFEPRANVGIHRGLAEIARRGAERLEGVQLHGFLDWLRDVGPELELPASSDVEILGKAARLELRRVFEPIHDWLGAVSGRASFFEDIDRMIDPAPVPEKDVFKTALAQIRARRDAPNVLRAI